MIIAKAIAEVRKAVREARDQGKLIGLVPTMGALHIGHMSLIKEAKVQSDFVAVSIFVNPTQFGPGEDLDTYPRPLEKDLVICRDHGVDLVFAPDVNEMYPEQNRTWVTVEKLTEPLCGRSRPGHFRGVTTVCAKLFNIVVPDKAFFGQKDAQQATVIRKMVRDLNLPLEIVVCPTVREADGLAVSSRNQYLNSKQREDAVVLYQSLQKCRSMVDLDVTDADKIEQQMREVLLRADGIEIEYIGLVDADTLEPVSSLGGRILVAVAARIGSTRLIDNIMLDIPNK